MILTPKQYERLACLRRSPRWTRFVRRGYPPCERTNVCVAWDAMGSCWALCYEREGIVPGWQTKRKFLKPFYYWRDESGEAMSPGPLMVEWLREHDMFSGEHVGVWSDAKFRAREQLAALREEKHLDEATYQIKQLWRPDVQVAVPAKAGGG